MREKKGTKETNINPKGPLKISGEKQIPAEERAEANTKSRVQGKQKYQNEVIITVRS